MVLWCSEEIPRGQAIGRGRGAGSRVQFCKEGCSFGNIMLMQDVENGGGGLQGREVRVVCFLFMGRSRASFFFNWKAREFFLTGNARELFVHREGTCDFFFTARKERESLGKRGNFFSFLVMLKSYFM